MIQNKNAFFIIEIIISIIIITGVVITLFKVKDNTTLFTSQIANKNIKNSLFFVFIPYLKKSENKSSTLIELYDLKNEKLKEKLSNLRSENIVLHDLKSTINGINIDKFNFLPKKIIVSQNKYKKIFYSFSVD